TRDAVADDCAFDGVLADLLGLAARPFAADRLLDATGPGGGGHACLPPGRPRRRTGRRPCGLGGRRGGAAPGPAGDRLRVGAPAALLSAFLQPLPAFTPLPAALASSAFALPALGRRRIVGGVRVPRPRGTVWPMTSPVLRVVLAVEVVGQEVSARPLASPVAES